VNAVRTSTLQLFQIDPVDFEPHGLHRADRDWTETNCWQDMMIETLSVLGLDPVAASAFTLSTDFEGSQWTLFKYPPEDLRGLFGIDIAELYVWRPLIEHLEIAFRDGQLLTAEVDAYYLPDTAGVTYGRGHVKTGIVPWMLDREGRRMQYFHNAGFFELSGDDFNGIFYLDGLPDAHVLPPYVELIRLDNLHRPQPAELTKQVVDLVREHLGRRPATNPIPRFYEHLQSDLSWIEENGEAAFHSYAFATCRQCGASAELAAAFSEWLDLYDGTGLAGAAENYRRISSLCKSVQFALARVARGRKVDLDGAFERMAQAWQEATDIMVTRYLD
jgi:Domain of unknown function (DUF1839)